MLRTARSLLRASQEQQLHDLAGAARRGAVPLLEAPAGARRVSSIISDLSSFVLPDSIVQKLQQWVPLAAATDDDDDYGDGEGGGQPPL